MRRALPPRPRPQAGKITKPRSHKRILAGSRLPRSPRGRLPSCPTRQAPPAGPRACCSPMTGCCGRSARPNATGPAAPHDRALIAGPLYHKNAMRVSVKPKLHVGASVVILPRFEPRLFLRALSEHRCTEAGGVPAMYRMMLAEQDLLDRLDFSSLEVLEMGSAVVGADMIAAVEAAFGANVIEAYGLTEGGGPLREAIDGKPAPRGSCGLAAPEVGVRLMGETGEGARRRRALGSIARGSCRLQQPARSRCRADKGRLAAHRRPVPARRRGVLLFPGQDRRPVLLRRREH